MDSLDGFVHKDFIQRELEYSEVYFYLDKYMDKKIYSVSDFPGKEFVKLNHTIWIFWMQGMEYAPELVQKCYESVCKSKPYGYEVILLTSGNLDAYIQLPEFIWKKYKDGCITTTHLSDIIRLELLCTYGGTWIDATVFCSRCIPDYMVSGDMFLFKASLMDDIVLKMSSWWMSADRSNRLIHAARNVLFSFWDNETNIRNYFLLHIIMSKLIDEDYECRLIFQGIPYISNSNPHVLQGKMSMEFDENEWEVIRNISGVHKLTYKQRYLRGDVYNYYQALLDDRLR